MDEYISNRNLARLAEELEILNKCLIGAKLPDQVRIDIMRSYGQTSRRMKEWEKEFNTEPKLPRGVSETPNGQYRVRLNTKGIRRCLGTYDTVEEADEAYKAAHIELFGTESRYYQHECEVV